MSTNMGTTNDVHPNTAMLHRYAEAWSSHDVEAVVDYFTDDAVYVDHSYEVNAAGKDAVRGFVTDMMEGMPDFQLTYPVCFATDTFGGVEWCATSTYQGQLPGLPIDGTGIWSETYGASIFEFRNGKISWTIDYYDYAAHLQDIGVLPKDLGRVVRSPGGWDA